MLKLKHTKLECWFVNFNNLKLLGFFNIDIEDHIHNSEKYDWHLIHEAASGHILP